MKQNTFKNNKEPQKIKRKLNPPHFEYAPISMERKGLFWMNAIIKTEFRRF